MLTCCQDELPNPHKECVREILNALICHDNDFRRINLELRNLQNEYKQEMEKYEFRCAELRRPICPITNKVIEFVDEVASIDQINECFLSRIDELKKKRDEILDTAKKCFTELNAEKCKLKQFHEKTIDYLKRHVIKSNDPEVIRNCERDICEMHKLFVKEVAHIKRCETELLPFFKQLQDCNLQYFCQYCCLKDYEWMPLGKTLQAVKEIAQDVKHTVGPTLRKAFAQLHVQQPQNAKNFLAGYLMNLERSEQMLQAKMNIFGNFKTTE